jgi:methionine-rich copper-binding protein CopC
VFYALEEAMIRLLSLAFVAVAFLASYGSAFAHADLASAHPPANGMVATAPTEVSITFTEDVEPKFSDIQVLDAEGKRVDEGAAHTAPDNDKLLSVGLKPLTAGTYKVIWHAMAADDAHKTRGDYTFTVKP